MDRKITRSINLFPWYAGLTGDLLFYIAINTLFLTVVKEFSAAQIVALTSFSQLACIVLQFPVLFLIRRMGNTGSVRVGALCLLLSSIFITFGRGFYLVLLGRLFHDVAIIFRSASFVALENNLDLVDRRRDFVKIRTAANTVYSVITMLISFVAGFMFNMNNYLPMYCCIGTCTVGFVLTLFMKDHSDYDKIIGKKEKKKKVKLNYSGLILTAIALYAIFYPVVNTGQGDGKLFIQQNVLEEFSLDNTSLILSGIVCISRIIRVISNILFARIYEKHQKKMGVAMPVALCASMGFLLFGSFIPQILLKIAVMSAGYIIILFVRDPFKLYIQDVLFEKTSKEHHQTLLTMLEFGVKLTTAGIGLISSAVLLRYPLVVIIAALFVLSLIDIVLGVCLHRMLYSARPDREATEG